MVSEDIDYKFQVDGGPFVSVDEIRIEDTEEERVHPDDTVVDRIHIERRISVSTDHGEMLLIPADKLRSDDE